MNWFELVLCVFAAFGAAVIGDVLVDKFRDRTRRERTRLTRGEVARIERSVKDRGVL